MLSMPFTAPAGYHVQILEATDGRIVAPDGWNYRSRGTPSGWLWTFSKESNADGSYETGLRLQLLVGVQKGTNKTPKEFALNFLEQKRRTARVINECGPSDQGHLIRQCLEVVEHLTSGGDPYHIVYSVFWGKEMDMVVLSTFGTPEELWPEYSRVAKVMSEVQIIGPNLGRGERRAP